MERFLDFVIPLLDRRFTQSKHQERVAMSRIYCFLISKEWEDRFPGVIQLALPPVMPYHCCIKLSSVVVNWGPKPFFI